MSLQEMANHQANLTWTESAPGYWERDLDEVEQFYTFLAKTWEKTGRTFFAVTGHLTLQVEISEIGTLEKTTNRLEEALQAAWIRLRYDHPTLASWVEYDRKLGKSKKFYESVTSTEDLKNWLKQTFRFVTNGQTGVEWCNADPPVPKLATIFLITPPTSCFDAAKTVRRDIVLRAHHEIVDGIGTLHMLNNFMRHAALAFSTGPNDETQFGTEHSNLSPPFRLAAPVPAQLTSKQEARFRETLAHNIKLRENVDILTVPFKRGAQLPGKHQRVDFTFSGEATHQLLTDCKPSSATITHVYHAAAAIVVRNKQERSTQERTKRYLNYCLVNERGNCMIPYNSPAHAVTVYHSVSGKALAIDLVIPASNAAEQELSQQKLEFRSILQQVKQYYCDVRSDTEHLCMVPSFWAMGAPTYPPTPDSPIPPPVPPPSLTPSVSISSMGLIDQIISPSQGPFVLENPWVTGEELGTGLGLFLGTFKGRLSISAAFNEAYHDRDEVLGFLSDLNSVVAQGLAE